MDSLIWNEIPTVPGNLGGLTFVGLMIYGTHAHISRISTRARLNFSEFKG